MLISLNPTSVHGAMKFAVVRFSNVICSRGSVIPKIELQIRRGGPVTLTYSDMDRFFISIPEAAYLVLQSGRISR